MEHDQHGSVEVVVQADEQDHEQIANQGHQEDKDSKNAEYKKNL